MSVDTGLIVEALRARGHAVGHIIPVPENAGEWEFEVDGTLLTLEQARALMEADDDAATPEASSHRPSRSNKLRPTPW